jgi:heat shock protein HslJ
MFSLSLRHYTGIVLAGIVGLLMVAGCAPPPLPEPTPGESNQTAPKEASDMTDLIGVTWQLDAYIEEGTEQSAVAEAPATLMLQEDGRFQGHTGCNIFSGSYELDGESLSFQPGPMTQKACAEPIARQERALLTGLKQVASFSLEGDQLRLLDAEGNPLLLLSPQQTPGLTDVSWQLLYFNNGRGGMEANLVTERITAQFDAQGTVSGNAGCNNYTARYQMEDGTLTISEIAVTEMQCIEPEGVMETESAFLQNLGRAATYRIEGDKLTLFDAYGGKLLVFKAAAPAQ